MLIRLLLVALLILPLCVFAHGVDESTQAFLQQNDGLQFFPFLYIGAKHMFTGYDHLLFLFGVLFFLYRGREVLLYISMFTLGHSITLLSGVLADIQLNAYLIDAIIGFSVLYKGFDNLGGFKRFLGRQPDTRAAVLIFGLFHGFGLATKLQAFELSGDGLWLNLLAFNLGVEIGQIMALLLMLILINAWRNSASFVKFSTITNSFLMSAGMMLIGYQLTGYFIG